MKFRIFFIDGSIQETDESIEAIRAKYRAGDIKKIKRIK